MSQRLGKSTYTSKERKLIFPQQFAWWLGIYLNVGYLIVPRDFLTSGIIETIYTKFSDSITWIH